MTDIVNFVPLDAKVEIRGQKITVRGLELEEIGGLLYRFPKFREIKQLNASDLIKLMDKDIQSAVIAAAAGRAGNEKAEKSFANLSLGERVKIVAKIIELTAPDGIGPFVDLIQTLMPAQLVEAAAAGDGRIVLRSRRSSKLPAS